VSRTPGASLPRRRGARLALILYGVAAAVLVGDRLSKVWATGSLQGRAPIKLIPGVLDLSFTTNRGGAFGLFGGASWLFFGATILVCAVIVYASFSLPGKTAAAGLGMVLGGAAGNLTDRLVNGAALSGRVVDFIHLHAWPVFNVADSAIVVGAATVVVASLLRSSRRGG
jgi:signal peptidase II